MSNAARSLLFGQLGFLFALGLCVLIDSAGLHSNHGWSYYEEHSRTLLPYLLGFIWLVVLIAYAAGLLARSAAPTPLPPLLKGLAVFLVFDVLTPDTVDAAFAWL